MDVSRESGHHRRSRLEIARASTDQSTNIHGSDLSDADLTRATLDDIDFSGADLSDALCPAGDVTGADLTVADVAAASYPTDPTTRSRQQIQHCCKNASNPPLELIPGFRWKRFRESTDEEMKFC